MSPPTASYRNLKAGILITGVGMTATALRMGRMGALQPALAVNVGIAGSFSRDLTIGSVVRVRRDVIADMGAEHGGRFVPMHAASFQENTSAGDAWVEDDPGRFSSFADALQPVSGITVNTVSGSAETIARHVRLFSPMTESMEGAAFLMACRENNWPSIQIRSVSNYIEPRHLSQWNIPFAIAAAGRFMTEFVNRMSTERSA